MLNCGQILTSTCKINVTELKDNFLQFKKKPVHSKIKVFYFLKNAYSWPQIRRFFPQKKKKKKKKKNMPKQKNIDNFVISAQNMWLLIRSALSKK